MSTISLAKTNAESTVAPEIVTGVEGLSASAPSYFPRRTGLDRVLAALLLVPALPMMGILIFIIRLTSKGSGIYRQQRVGLDGRIFTMFKLRSMRCDAEQSSGPVWSPVKLDTRVTWIGQILRKCHLDELPQLFNVLRGDMALVGPRPERPEFVKVLSDAIPAYRQRLVVRPGITGLAQLNLPPDSDLDSVRRKLVLDLQYIEQAGLWMDFRLLLATSLRIFRVPGGAVLSTLRLSRKVCLVEASKEIELGDRSMTVDQDTEQVSSDLLVKLLEQTSSGNGQAHGDAEPCHKIGASLGNGSNAGAAPHSPRSAPHRTTGRQLPR